MTDVDALASYRRESLGSAHVLAWAAALAWSRGVLDSGSTLYDWAAERPDADALRGRGVVFAVDAPLNGPDARSRWAVRHYERGGAVASWLGDRYLALGPTRPEREVATSVEARARGVPTPAVVAAAWYRTGPWYRADLVTELVPHARSLSAALFEADRTSVALDQLRMCGRLVKRLEAAGVRHADLNGMNILVSGPEDAISVHVLDLDRAHVGDAGRGGAAMRNRLRRSLRAVGGRSGRPLSGPEWQALDDGLRGEP